MISAKSSQSVLWQKGAFALTLLLFCAAGIIKGDIKLEGHDKEQGPFARVSGYVEQVRIFALHAKQSSS